MNFHDIIKRDLEAFFNPLEFAEKATIVFPDSKEMVIDVLYQNPNTSSEVEVEYSTQDPSCLVKRDSIKEVNTSCSLVIRGKSFKIIDIENTDVDMARLILSNMEGYSE